MSLSRRLATPLIAASAVAGLVFGVTSGVAAADPPQSSRSLQDAQLLLSKEVVGSNVVLPGASVTYRTTIAYTTANGVGNAPLNQLSIAYVREVPPAGWTRTAQSLSYAGGGGTFSTQDGGAKVTCSSGCTFLVGGYVIKSGQSAVLTTTYTVPAGTAPGVYDSGAFSAQPNTWSGGERGSNNFGVFVQVADPNVATTTTLNAPGTATVGQSVALTANVGPANSVGTVQFKDGGVDIGGPVTVSGGNATLNHTFTTAGNHDITAAFTAGAGFYNSASGVQTVAVSLAESTTTLNVPATAHTDEAIDLTANVAPADATGTVQFKDDATDIGAPVPVNAGTATLNHTFTTVGNHDITAVYSGDATHAGSTSSVSAVDVSVKVVDSTTTLTAPATATIGAAVDLSATVAPADATGTVEFKDGATVLGSAPVTAGTATLNHTFTTTGNHDITAVYSGDATHNPSTSAAATVDVTVVESAVTLTAPATTDTTTPVELTATVSPADATGTVEFKDGATVLGSSPVTAGTATLSHTFTAGTHSITAVYSGDSTHAGSTSAASAVEVSEAVVDTTTALTVPATAKNGTAVDLTATVDPAAATGTVEFKDGATVLGSSPVVNGVATLNHTFTTDGTHSITAVYSGDATHNPSTSAADTVDVSTDIVIVDTTTALSVPASAETGTAVELKATVSPTDATGTVEFKDGTEVIGTAPVVNGVATLSHTFTTDGTHSITAVYSGDATHNTSISTAGSIEVSTDPGTGGGGSSFGSLENLFGS
ncbi:beta strand repeat-containing protein [Rhodococcus sp. NPDC003322]